MIGDFSTNTNDARYRDLAEYVTMEILKETWEDLRKQNIKITGRLMQAFRDEWTRDGKPMDFTTMRAKASDFERLLRLTGATSFGKLSEDPNKPLSKAISEFWLEKKTEYDQFRERGEYLHVITDPEIRSYILNNTNAPLNKSIFVHRGKSARELNVGEQTTFYDRTDPNFRYEANVGQANVIRRRIQDELETRNPVTNTQTRQGFNQAGVAGQNQSQNQAQAFNPTDIDITDEQFLGWEGGVKDEKEYRGLKDVLGAYFTRADAEEIAKNFDNNELIDGQLAQNSLELVKYMRSKGYDFNVRSSQERNQIDVRMQTGENLSVRVFDTEKNGMFIGRVYDDYNEYYFSVNASEEVQNKAKFTPEDSIALLDYVTGNRTAKVEKAASRPTSFVKIDGLPERTEPIDGRTYPRGIRVKPINNRYRAVVFGDSAEAEEYIRTAINDAREVVNNEFKLEEIQALIDRGLDDEEIMVTSPEFQAEFEKYYSKDDIIRKAQEEAVQLMYHSEEGGLEKMREIRDAIVGDYENGFNPSFVVDHMKQSGRGNEREAMLAALKTADYDLSKIKGNDFGVNNMKERLVKFDPETARSIDEIDHPMLKKALETVRDTLKAGDAVGPDGPKSDPIVLIDEKGVIKWEANRKTGSKKNPYELVSGEIGQVFVPDENGIIKTKFQGENNYGIVPGYTGYFSFEGDYNNRMERFRVKGFEQHLTEQLRAKVQHQLTRPFIKKLNNIPTTLDASGLNGLYHGDVYGKRIELDFMETNQLNQETKEAILRTLSNRVRFDNQYSDYATTSAETAANRAYGNNENDSSFSYWKVAGEKNMRVLDADIENYADLTMTGTGKTQGLIWYLTDGAKVNEDGSVTPSKGMIDKDGNLIPDKTALKKLDYFKNEKFNAWDRTQMSANQLMTALRVDEKVNTALMSFGGWTFDDSYVVSKEFAKRNKVFGEKPNEESMRQLDELLHYMSTYENVTKEEVLAGTGMMWSDEVIKKGLELREKTLVEDRNERAKNREAYQAFLEEHGRFRPLQRGDKISDFGGNKGTIGIVIDRWMPDDEAEKQGLGKEVRFMRANPDLDVIAAPYSMLSRHNAGVVKELMSGEPKDLIDPDTGEVYKAAMGQLNIIVTDMVVDAKTHAYTKEDVLEGKGRKASGQLAWALQSKGATGILNEIYGRNDSAWETYREYLIATGLDMKPDGTIVEGYQPHAGENRNLFEYDPNVTSEDFLDNIKDAGGFLDLPFDVEFKTGNKTNELPILSASLRQNVELVDGSMRRSDFTNHYANIYEAVGEFMNAESEEQRIKAQQKAQNQFDQIQSTIIDRQFNGGHNGKHSFLRDKIMGKRMMNSATGVAIVDPRLEIGQVGMNQDMMDALTAKEGDVVMMFRDPVWRDGAIRAMTVVKDDTAHGVAFNPITDKSHDGDFDGDSYGVIKFNSKQANRDLINKFSHWANMIDKGTGKDELYFQTGMDLASAQARAKKLGDKTPEQLLEKVKEQATSSDPRILKQAQKNMSKYSHKLFREHSFGADYVSLENDEAVFESFKKMVENGAKGSPKKLEEYKQYHIGKKTMEDAREIQYATGVKSDDTGLAGSFSQKLVSTMRNQNITAALESMYPLTQGTLQIKHDAKHARVVNEILTEDMNKIFRGVDLTDPKGKRKLTPHTFKQQLSDTLHNKMGVDVNEKWIDAVTETLTHNGQIIPLKEAMALKGSPMDKVAYGGGYEELKNLAKKGESLLEGEQNKLFAPYSMRYADEQTKLAKRDTQRVAEQEAEEAIENKEPKMEVKQLSLFAESDAGLAL